ncbi:MAG: SBBP repeat-containing protein, partial [Candidatus Heimdallarchaeota archaeon]|nr:SBBP repeat-containing protein [Candidatus Heimdallarchaeota archaeon]
DSSGSIYVTGETNNLSFPNTTLPFNETTIGGVDIFITKLNLDASNIIYSTIIGGSGNDIANALVLDGLNNVYIGGETSSGNFPTTLGSWVTTANPSGNNPSEGFLLKLSNTGDNLVYSSYIVGIRLDVIYDITIDSSMNIYATGSTKSADFYISGDVFAPTSIDGGTIEDSFILVLNADGSNVTYSSYISGNGKDWGYSIELDVSGNIYVVGETTSDTFYSTIDAYNQTRNGNTIDAFILKVNSDLSNVTYCTYYGGSGIDIANDLEIQDNILYITGETTSTDFITSQDAYNQTFSGGIDSFILQFDLNSGPIYSTYFGGEGNDVANDLEVDINGDMYVVGSTTSTLLPLNNEEDSLLNGTQDAFALKINSFGTLDYSSYLGGNQTDAATSLVVNSNYYMIIAGQTSSLDFPTANPYNDTYFGGAGDAFLTIIGDPYVEPPPGYPSLAITSPSNNGIYRSSGLTLTYTVSPSDVSIYVDGSINTTSMPSGTSLSHLSEGIHNITITATNITVSTIRTVVFSIDNTPPIVDILTPSPNQNFENESISIQLNYTVSDGSVIIRIDDVDNSTSIESGSFVSSLTNGSHTIVILSTDIAGNLGQDSVTFSIGPIPVDPVDPEDPPESLSSTSNSPTDEPNGLSPALTATIVVVSILVVAGGAAAVGISRGIIDVVQVREGMGSAGARMRDAAGRAGTRIRDGTNNIRDKINNRRSNSDIADNDD